MSTKQQQEEKQQQQEEKQRINELNNELNDEPIDDALLHMKRSRPKLHTNYAQETMDALITESNSNNNNSNTMVINESATVPIFIPCLERTNKHYCYTCKQPAFIRINNRYYCKNECSK